jgi:hypothetical protein
MSLCTLHLRNKGTLGTRVHMVAFVQDAHTGDMLQATMIHARGSRCSRTRSSHSLLQGWKSSL